MLVSNFGYQNQSESNWNNTVTKKCAKLPPKACTKSTELAQYTRSSDLSSCSNSENHRNDKNKCTSASRSWSVNNSKHYKRKRNASGLRKTTRCSKAPSPCNDELINYRQMIAECVTRKLIIPLQKIDESDIFRHKKQLDTPTCVTASTSTVECNSKMSYTLFDEEEKKASGVCGIDKTSDMFCVISEVRGDAVDVYDTDNSETFIDVDESSMSKNYKFQTTEKNCEINECFMDLLDTVETMTDPNDVLSDNDGNMYESKSVSPCLDNEDQLEIDPADSESELVIDTSDNCDSGLVDEDYLRRNGIIGPRSYTSEENEDSNFSVQSLISQDEMSYENRIPKLLIKHNRVNLSGKNETDTSDKLERASYRINRKYRHTKTDRYSSEISTNDNDITPLKSHVPLLDVDSSQQKIHRGKRRNTDDIKSRSTENSQKKKYRSNSEKLKPSSECMFSEMRLENELPGFNWLENKIKNCAGKSFECTPKHTDRKNIIRSSTARPVSSATSESTKSVESDNIDEVPRIQSPMVESSPKESIPGFTEQTRELSPVVPIDNTKEVIVKLLNDLITCIVNNETANKVNYVTKTDRMEMEVKTKDATQFPHTINVPPEYIQKTCLAGTSGVPCEETVKPVSANIPESDKNSHVLKNVSPVIVNVSPTIFKTVQIGMLPLTHYPHQENLIRQPLNQTETSKSKIAFVESPVEKRCQDERLKGLLEMKKFHNQNANVKMQHRPISWPAILSSELVRHNYRPMSADNVSRHSPNQFVDKNNQLMKNTEMAKNIIQNSNADYQGVRSSTAAVPTIKGGGNKSLQIRPNTPQKEAQIKSDPQQVKTIMAPPLTSVASTNPKIDKPVSETKPITYSDNDVKKISTLAILQERIHKSLAEQKIVPKHTHESSINFVYSSRNFQPPIYGKPIMTRPAPNFDSSVIVNGQDITKFERLNKHKNYHHPPPNVNIMDRIGHTIPPLYVPSAQQPRDVSEMTPFWTKQASKTFQPKVLNVLSPDSHSSFNKHSGVKKLQRPVPNVSRSSMSQSKINDDEVTILETSNKNMPHKVTSEHPNYSLNNIDGQNLQQIHPPSLEHELQKYKRELFLLEQMAKKRESERLKLLHIHEKKLGILETLERKQRLMRSLTQQSNQNVAMSDKSDESTLLKLLKAQKEGAENSQEYAALTSGTSQHYSINDASRQLQTSMNSRISGSLKPPTLQSNFPRVMEQSDMRAEVPYGANDVRAYSVSRNGPRTQGISREFPQQQRSVTDWPGSRYNGNPHPAFNNPMNQFIQNEVNKPKPQSVAVTTGNPMNSDNVLLSQGFVGRKTLSYLPNFEKEQNAKIPQGFQLQNELNHPSAFNNTTTIERNNPVNSRVITQNPNNSALVGLSNPVPPNRTVYQQGGGHSWTFNSSSTPRIPEPNYGEKHPRVVNSQVNSQPLLPISQNSALSKEMPRSISWNSDRNQGNMRQLPSKQLKCKKCDKKAIFICSGCKNAWYCTPLCQRLDWLDHYSSCK